MDSVYGFEVFGFIPCLMTPRADYTDFMGAVIDKDSLVFSLTYGHMPPGLLLRNRKTVYQVWGGYGERQRLVIEGRWAA